MKSNDLQMNLRKKRNITSYHNIQHYKSLKQYEKVAKTNIDRQGQQRTSDHGSIAKLLVKFINQINSNCRQNKFSNKDKQRRNTSHCDERVDPNPHKKIKLDKNNDTRKNISHNNEEKVQEKFEDKKYAKELHRFKDQHLPQYKSIISQIKTGQDYISTIQHPIHSQHSSDPVAMMYLNQNFFNNNEFLNIAHLHNLPGAMYNINSLAPIDTMNFNMHMQQFGQKLSPNFCPSQTLMKMNNSHISQPTQPQRKPQKTSENKLFKRAAFHVAIAYHIHLKKIQDKEKNHDIVELDPTYYAKRLRQKNNDHNMNKQEASLKETLGKQYTTKPSDTIPATYQQLIQTTIEASQFPQMPNTADQREKFIEILTIQL